MGRGEVRVFPIGKQGSACSTVSAACVELYFKKLLKHLAELIISLFVSLIIPTLVFSLFLDDVGRKIISKRLKRTNVRGRRHGLRSLRPAKNLGLLLS